jgi:hypothetical protein
VAMGASRSASQLSPLDGSYLQPPIDKSKVENKSRAKAEVENFIAKSIKETYQATNIPKTKFYDKRNPTKVKKNSLYITRNNVNKKYFCFSGAIHSIAACVRLVFLLVMLIAYKPFAKRMSDLVF